MTLEQHHITAFAAGPTIVLCLPGLVCVPGGGQGGLYSVSVRPGGSDDGLSSQSVVVGGGSVSPHGLRDDWGGPGGIVSVSVSSVSVSGISVSSVSVSGVSMGGISHGSSDGLGNDGRSNGLRDDGSVGSIGDNWGMASVGQMRSVSSIGQSRGGISNWGRVGIGDVLLGGHGLDESGLLVGLHDGLSLHNLLLDSMGVDRADDVLAVHDRAALVGHSSWDIVYLVANLGNVGLLHDGNLGLNLSPGAAGDHVLLDVRDWVAGIAGGHDGAFPMMVTDARGRGTSQNGSNNDLQKDTQKGGSL